MPASSRLATIRLLLPALLFSAAAGAAEVGVSVSVDEPGFYGRIDIGDFRDPPLIYREPVIVEEIRVTRAPVYMHVPPGHAKNWAKHCHKYGACAQRVLFVEEGWYQDVYVPHAKAKKAKKAKRHDKGHGKDHGKD